MSFAGEVKKELCGVWAENACCRKAECYGLLLGGYQASAVGVVLKTESEAVARRFCKLLEEVCGVLVAPAAPKGGGLFRVRVADPAACRAVLERFGHTGDEPFLRVNRANFEEDACPAAFLRGFFLACGSVTDPQRAYHLEFAAGKYHLAFDVALLLAEALSRPKLTQRGGGYVVYYKESESIEDALTYMQATRSSLALMEVKMMKQLRNRVNRATNCETANLSKSLEAGRRQLQAIERLEQTAGLSALPTELQEVARLRRENPEASLSELGQMLAEPLSRSGVNHRLARVVAIAEAVVTEKQKSPG